jgi:hypothetical protein
MMDTESSGVQRYQFTAEQTKIISSLAFHLRITGMMISAAGLFLCAGLGLFSLTGLGGIGAFLIGVLLIRAAGSFQQISGAGNGEIGQLLEALTYLRNAHRLITALMVILMIVYLGVALYLRWSS